MGGRGLVAVAPAGRPELEVGYNQDLDIKAWFGIFVDCRY